MPFIGLAPIEGFQNNSLEMERHHLQEASHAFIESCARVRMGRAGAYAGTMLRISMTTIAWACIPHHFKYGIVTRVALKLVTMVVPKNGTKEVQIVTLDKHEHLSLLSCINVWGGRILILAYSRQTNEEELHLEVWDGSCTAMQPKAWVTSYLSHLWPSHFVECFQAQVGRMSHHHLLIKDKHNFHVTIDVVWQSTNFGLGFCNHPFSHITCTSHWI